MACRALGMKSIGVLLCLGCTFQSEVPGNSSGLGGTESTSTGAPPESTTNDAPSTSTSASTTSVTAATDVDPTEVGSDTEDNSGSSGDEQGSSGAVAETAVLSLLDAPTYDYALVDLGTAAPHTFDVENQGGGAASNIVVGFTGPFSFVGGAFPGAGGSCEGTLPAGEACTIEVEFTPGGLGPADGTLTLDYHDGVADQQLDMELTGGGQGMSEELIENGDAESCVSSNPPSGWTVTRGSWLCWDGDPWGIPTTGAALLAAGYGPDEGDFRMHQDVSMGELLPLVEAGALRFSFTGRGRNWDWNNNDYRVEVQFRNAGGQVIEEYDSGFEVAPAWFDFTDTRVAPVDTAGIRVLLRCEKGGDDNCDGFFDDLSLRALYP